jgi:hypothetical protein
MPSSHPESPAQPALQPYLTVLDHWHVGLLGARAEIVLDGAFALSRTTPGFGPQAVPLGDRNISRSPMHFINMGLSGMALDMRQSTTRVQLNGARVSGVCVISWEAMRRGVVIELGPQVMLLLHVRAPA